MKKVICWSVLILMMSTAMGQGKKAIIETDFNPVFNSTSEVENFAKAVVTKCRGYITYQFDTLQLTSMRSYRIYFISDNHNEDMNLHILFSENIVGENTALKIKGRNQLTIESVTGEYDQAFDFWKNFVNPNADKVNVATRKPNDFTGIAGEEALLKVIKGKLIHIWKQPSSFSQGRSGELWEITIERTR